MAGLAFAWGLFALLAGGDFTSLGNTRLMLLQTAVVGTAAVGATIIIISGGIDLSVGSTIALGTVVAALLLQAGFPPAVAAAGALGASLLVGASIGAFVIGHAGRIAALAVAALMGVTVGGSAGPLAGILAALAAATGEDVLEIHLPGSPPVVEAILALWLSRRGRPRPR